MSNPSCIVIGDAGATQRCAEILLERGHRLLGLVTHQPRLATWAGTRGVRIHFAPPESGLRMQDLLDLARGFQVDYLFSIHNVRLLSPGVIGLARRMAVNYHDALLPRLAGLHATSWAIISGERRHGITWHRIATGVDTGEILLQQTLELRPEETAWTLNTRCAAAAVETFPTLVEGLTTDTLRGRKQDQSERTLFTSWQKPAPACAVPWDRTAVEVAAFVRGLDFGAADNPMGRPKVITPGGVFVAQAIQVLERCSGAAPGTVLAIDAAGLEIATTTNDVSVGAIADLDGNAVSAAEVAARLAVLPGTVLGVPSHPAEWSARERTSQRHESYWIAALAALTPLAPVGFERDARICGEARHELRLPTVPGASQQSTLAGLLAWLFAEVGQPFDIALGEAELREELTREGLDAIYALRPPLRVDLARLISPSKFHDELEQTRRTRRERGTYALDLASRTKLLRNRVVNPLVVIDLLGPGERAAALPHYATLGVWIASDGRTVVWRAARGSPEALASLAARFTRWLKATTKTDAPLPTLIDRCECPRATHAPTVLEAFRERAARTPEAAAIEVAGCRWSYRELAGRSTRLAAALRRRGVRREHVVALRLSAIADIVTGMLGVLEAGAAFVVLEAAEAPRRLLRILEESKPACAITDRGDPVAPNVPAHAIAMADSLELPPVAPRPPCGEDLAYLAFTSGSTGTPKGVAIEHHSLAHYILFAARHYGIAPGSRVLQMGSTAFDLAYEQIFGALCHGATLVSLPGPLPSTRALLSSCARLGITLFDVPTPVWEQIVIDLEHGDIPWPPDIELVLVGGAPASTRGLRTLREVAGSAVRFVNSYGPTESTIVATLWEAAPDGDRLRDRPGLPIGRPIPGITTRVLDAAGRAVPAGEAGELWLGGAGLARGYHRRPERTGASFVTLDCPAPRRFYRTGDQVRLDAEGELEFLGRIDRQIKIAGRRVEPAEIEAALREVEGVEDALVRPLFDERALPRIAAWIVISPRGPSLAALREEVADRLPSFMRPTHLIPVPVLPRAPSGKVDVAALTGMLNATPGAGPAGVLDPVETAVRAMWCRVLGTDDFRNDQDFFDAGGDSLAAVALLAQIEQRWRLRIPVSRFPGLATVSALAKEIRGPQTLHARSHLISLQPLGERAPFVCVHGLSGHVLRLIPLARALAPAQPVLGLQCPGLEDDEPILTSIEALAKVFLWDLRARLGPGPYRLGGLSFGGLVALEMARQATLDGLHIELLVLFDTELAGVLPALPRKRTPLLKVLRNRWCRLVGASLSLGRRVERDVVRGRDETQYTQEYRSFDRVQRINETAAKRYRLNPYPGVVTYFAVRTRETAMFDALRTATGCTVDVADIPGNHLTMLEPPNVAKVADELHRRLARLAPEYDLNHRRQRE